MKYYDVCLEFKSHFYAKIYAKSKKEAKEIAQKNCCKLRDQYEQFYSDNIIKITGIEEVEK